MKPVKDEQVIEFSCVYTKNGMPVTDHSDDLFIVVIGNHDLKHTCTNHYHLVVPKQGASIYKTEKKIAKLTV